MAVLLEGIALPDDIQWLDEFAGFGVGQEITPTLTGSLVIEERSSAAGRPITLESNGASWITKATASALATLAATPVAEGQALTLDWHGTIFNVVFDRSSGSGFRAVEVMRLAANAQTADHPYTVSLNLIVRD